MTFTKEELLLMFVALTQSIKNADGEPTPLMVTIMNKISDELTK